MTSITEILENAFVPLGATTFLGLPTGLVIALLLVAGVAGFFLGQWVGKRRAEKTDAED